jgi:hypothetical protein
LLIRAFTKAPEREYYDEGCMSKPRKHPRFLPAKMETEREKYDAYEWCKSELPGCERQVSTTAILNNGIPPHD